MPQSDNGNRPIFLKISGAPGENILDVVRRLGLGGATEGSSDAQAAAAYANYVGAIIEDVDPSLSGVVLTGGDQSIGGQKNFLRKLNGQLLSTTFYPAIILYGDSTDVGVTDGGTTDPTLAIGYLLGLITNLQTFNRANAGHQLCDIANTIFQTLNVGYTQCQLLDIRPGINDANLKGAGAYEAVYQLILDAVLCWTSTPAISKVFAQTATKVGTWSNENALVTAGVASKTHTQGDTCTFTQYSDFDKAYLLYEIFDGKGGTFDISVNGGAPIHVNSFTVPAVAGNAGSVQAPAYIEFDVNPGENNEIEVTVTSATDANNPVCLICSSATPSQWWFQPPAVNFGGVTKQKGDTKAADTLAYNDRNLASAAKWANRGHPVMPYDVRAWVNDTTDMQSGADGQVHFGAAGYPKIALGIMKNAGIIPNTSGYLPSLTIGNSAPTPASGLSVQGDARFYGNLRVQTGGADINIQLGQVGSVAGIQSFNGAISAYEQLSLLASKYFFDVGPVGIGTASPVCALDVAGPIRHAQYFVSTLPSATLGAGMRAQVADANTITPVLAAAPIGGGGFVAPVYSDGTIWRFG